MTVKLRYIETSQDMAASTLLLSLEQERELQLRLLARLGIEPEPGELPLHAWLRVMHVENGLVPQLPAHPAILDAVYFDAEARRFMFVLA
jgi:hypothetical protein